MKPITTLIPDPLRRIPDSEIHDPLDNLWNEFKKNELKDLMGIFKMTVDKISLIDPTLPHLLDDAQIITFNSEIAVEVKKLLEKLFPLLKENPDFLENSSTLIVDITRRTVGSTDNILAIQEYCLSIFRNFFDEAKGNFAIQNAEESAQIFYENLSILDQESCMGGNSGSSEDISRKRRTSQLSLFEPIKDSLLIPLFDEICKSGNHVHVNSLINLLFGDLKAKTRDDTVFAASLHTSIPQLHVIIRKTIFERFDLICEYLAREYEKIFSMPDDFDMNLEILLHSQGNELLSKLCKGENAIDHNKINAARNNEERSRLVRAEFAQKLKKQSSQWKVIEDESEVEFVDDLCLCASYVLKNSKIPVWLQRRMWDQKDKFAIRSTRNKLELNQKELKEFILEYIEKLDQKHQINFDILRNVEFHNVPMQRQDDKTKYLKECLECGEEFDSIREDSLPVRLRGCGDFDLSGILFHPDQYLLLTLLLHSLTRGNENSEVIAQKIIDSHLKKFVLSGDYDLINYGNFLSRLFLRGKLEEIYFHEMTAEQFTSTAESAIINLENQDGGDGAIIASLTLIDAIKSKLFKILLTPYQSDSCPQAENIFQIITFDSNNPLSLARSLKKIIERNNNDVLLVRAYYQLLSDNIEFIVENFRNPINDSNMNNFITDLIEDNTYNNIAVSERKLARNIHDKNVETIESCKRSIINFLAEKGNNLAQEKSLMMQTPSVSANARPASASRLLPLGSREAGLEGE